MYQVLHGCWGPSSMNSHLLWGRQVIYKSTRSNLESARKKINLGMWEEEQTL